MSFEKLVKCPLSGFKFLPKMADNGQFFINQKIRKRGQYE